MEPGEGPGPFPALDHGGAGRLVAHLGKRERRAPHGAGEFLSARGVLGRDANLVVNAKPAIAPAEHAGAKRLRDRARLRLVVGVHGRLFYQSVEFRVRELHRTDRKISATLSREVDFALIHADAADSAQEQTSTAADVGSVPGAKAGQSDVTINKFVIMNRQHAHLEHSLFSRSFLEHDGQLRGPFCVKTPQKSISSRSASTGTLQYIETARNCGEWGELIGNRQFLPRRQ